MFPSASGLFSFPHFLISAFPRFLVSRFGFRSISRSVFHSVSRIVFCSMILDSRPTPIPVPVPDSVSVLPSSRQHLPLLLASLPRSVTLYRRHHLITDSHSARPHQVESCRSRPHPVTHLKLSTRPSPWPFSLRLLQAPTFSPSGRQRQILEMTSMG